MTFVEAHLVAQMLDADAVDGLGRRRLNHTLLAALAVALASIAIELAPLGRWRRSSVLQCISLRREVADLSKLGRSRSLERSALSSEQTHLASIRRRWSDSEQIANLLADRRTALGAGTGRRDMAAR